jgi:hypothetical protein
VRWHEEALDDDGRRAASRLAAALAGRFYLAGGTGLALRLGHRVSLDLDLFAGEGSLAAAERDEITEALSRSGDLRVLESRDGTCHLRVGRTMASLFRYRYPLLDPPSDWRGLPVASLRDIAAMKVSALVGRGARKDFVDVHAGCGRIGLPGVLAACEARFPDHDDFVMQALRALVYFEDAEKEPMPRLLRPVSWERIKAYFEREVPRALRARLDGRRRR